MNRLFAAALFLCLVSQAGAKELERIKLSFDLIESGKKLSPQNVLPSVTDLKKRGFPDGFKYLAGGDFTLPAHTEEHFLLRQGSAELALTFSWQPVISGGIRKIGLKYRAILYYPMQKYAELSKEIEISPGTALLITESDSVSGGIDTRPVMAALSADFAEPSFGFPVLGGIGAKIQAQSGYPFISEVIDGGPAQAAGIKYGDEITEIDGYATLQMNLEKVSKLLRGDPGTKVKLKLRKAGKNTYEEKELTRRLLE